LKKPPPLLRTAPEADPTEAKIVSILFPSKAVPAIALFKFEV